MSFAIFFILTGAGLLAGLVKLFTVYVDLPFNKPDNTLLEDEPITLKNDVWVAILGYLIVGLAGSLLAPLLNAIIGLKGLETVNKPTSPEMNTTLWVLFGYGLVFGYSTTRLLVSILDPLIKKIATLQSNTKGLKSNPVTLISAHKLVGTDTGNIIDECESQFETYKSDCSGFVKAVAAAFAITLIGQADDIIDQIQTGSWTQLGNDGAAAKTKADAGWFVIAGLKGDENVPAQANGHVAVIVSGPLAQGKYPTGYWGKLGGVGEKNKTINWAWNAASRDNVVYSAYQI